MLTLYYAPGACSMAPHITLEEARADYTAVRIDELGGEHLTEAYRKINPRAKVPALKLDEGTVRRNSPLLMKPVTKRIVLAVGEKEPEEFHRQQGELAAAWKKAGAALEIVDAPRLHHFDILEKFGDAGHPIGKAALALVGG